MADVVPFVVAVDAEDRNPCILEPHLLFSSSSLSTEASPSSPLSLVQDLMQNLKQILMGNLGGV